MVVAPEVRIRALMTAHFDFVWRSLRRLGLPSADANDGAQEVFVIASRKLSAITPQTEKRLLFATVLDVAAKRCRRLKRGREAPLVGLEEQDSQRDRREPNAERRAELARARCDLSEILATMKLEQRVVFVLYELEEMPVPEIAGLLGLPLAMVGSRLHGAREEFDLSLRRLRARTQLPGVKT
jgi:RNA polymerase sigma-70 factor (ECF subfamily)